MSAVEPSAARHSRRPSGSPGRRRPSADGPAACVQVVYRDGSVRDESMPADQHVALWARVVHEHHAGLVEFVAATRNGDGSLRMRGRTDEANYPPCSDVSALVALAAAARQCHQEAFATPLPRSIAKPGKRAVTPGRVVWVDVDGVDDQIQPAWLEELRPHAWLASGGGLHAYWRLDRELPGEELESCNRRLAHAFGGDLACTDRGRIMRLPGTVNHKHGRWCRIIGVDLTRALVDPDRLRLRLRDPEPPRPPRRTVRRIVRDAVDDLALIPPPEYFRSLAACEVPSRGGYVHCPLPDHDDVTASCHVWADAERGWWCFGCSRGGGIYDFVSLIQGGPSGSRLRGAAFGRARAAALARLG